MAEYGRSVLAVRTPHQYQLDQDMRRRLATAHHRDDYVDAGGLAGEAAVEPSGDN